MSRSLRRHAQFLWILSIALTISCTGGQQETPKNTDKKAAGDVDITKGSARLDVSHTDLNSLGLTEKVCQQVMQDYSCNLTQSPSSILECVTEYSRDYSIDVVADTAAGFWEGDTVRIKKAGVSRYSWTAFPESQFIISTSLLYYTEFDPASTGLWVVAFNLETQDTIWVTPVTAMGDVAHSKYRNWGARLHLLEKVIVVCGAEVACPYVALLDVSTGRQLAHREDSWNR